MSLKFFKPTTPSNRGRLITLRSKLWKGNSINKLTTGLSKKSGRNNFGRITVFTKGGGHNNNYRKIDYKRSIINIPAIVNLNKTYLKSQIVDINNNLIKLDAGFKSNITITKNELIKSLKSKSSLINKNFKNNQISIGNTITFYFYQMESLLNDSIIDFKSYRNKIIKKEYLKYRKYNLPMILCQKIIENKPIKGIIIPKKRKRKKKLKIIIGIGGMLLRVKKKK